MGLETKIQYRLACDVSWCNRTTSYLDDKDLLLSVVSEWSQNGDRWFCPSHKDEYERETLITDTVL